MNPSKTWVNTCAPEGLAVKSKCVFIYIIAMCISPLDKEPVEIVMNLLYLDLPLSVQSLPDITACLSFQFSVLFCRLFCSSSFCVLCPQFCRVSGLPILDCSISGFSKFYLISVRCPGHNCM